mgnify:CR=1 FL=1
MRNGTRKAAGMLCALLAAVGVTCVALRLPAGAGRKAAVAAAGFILPAGNTDGFFSEEEEDDGSSSSQAQNNGPQTSSSSPSSSSGAASSGKAGSPSSGAQSSSGKVVEMCVGNSGTRVGNMWVRNSTSKNAALNLNAELQKAPAVKIRRNDGPQVLIYHTHTTEAFAGDTRTTDKARSVCAVGDRIAAQLTAGGIGVVHDTTYHDYPAYDGSYDRSRVTMQNDLKKYPTIQVTLDIHRDAMHRDDGTALKTTTVVNGKKAAQLMIISGCDDDGTLKYPNWEYNLRLALRFQKALSDTYPSLARPLDFCARKYNQDMTKGSLLIEIGTDVNTLDEAEYTGELLGKVLAQVLGGMT